MAAPSKRRNVSLNEKNVSKDENKESEEDDRLPESTVIQVEFEGRNPIDTDFHGIKQLLNQLFLKAHVNLSELTELIIKQNHVGSVLKQSEVGDETDEEDSDPNDVFGVTTVLNITEKQKYESISQIKDLLTKLVNEFASKEAASFINEMLSDDSKHVGLLINERFVNIPSKIAVPLMRSLSWDIKRALNKKMDYDFSYLILICKLYKTEIVGGKSKSLKSEKNGGNVEIIWSNPEEEIIDQEADVKFEFSVKDEADSGLIGDWNETDDEMNPMRRILVIPFNKFDKIIDKVEEAVS